MLGAVVSLMLVLGALSAILMGAVKFLEALASGIGHAWRSFESQEKDRAARAQEFHKIFPRGSDNTSRGAWDDRY